VLAARTSVVGRISSFRSFQSMHGVSFENARSVFGDVNALTFFDGAHSGSEDRFLTIGFADSGILLMVVHTDRSDTTRLISARPATSREGLAYAKRRE